MCATVALVAAACGGDAATTTTAAAAFTVDDLAMAILQDGDAWATPVVGTVPMELTIDDVWPAVEFPDQRAAYEGAGFLAGSFALFGEEAGIVITGAHLFSDAQGAATALDLIQSSFSDVDLVAQITGLAPGSLTTAEPLEVGDLGDAAVGVRVTGPESQVVGVVWTTGNLLQFVRAGMALGDDAREAAEISVAEAMAARMA
ncbi:MAG TPA: hypothetical protein VGB41_00770 [Acidimicrobiia bacterium]